MQSCRKDDKLKIWFCFIGVLVVFLIGCFSSPYLQWREYSPTLLKDKLADGKVVLVHGIHGSQVASAQSLSQELETEAVRRSVHRHGVVCLRLDLNGHSKNESLLKSITGDSTFPVVAVFSPKKPKSPIILSGKNLNRQEIRKAIQDSLPKP